MLRVVAVINFLCCADFLNAKAILLTGSQRLSDIAVTGRQTVGSGSRRWFYIRGNLWLVQWLPNSADRPARTVASVLVVMPVDKTLPVVAALYRPAI